MGYRRSHLGSQRVIGCNSVEARKHIQMSRIIDDIIDSETDEHPAYNTVIIFLVPPQGPYNPYKYYDVCHQADEAGREDGTQYKGVGIFGKAGIAPKGHPRYFSKSALSPAKDRRLGYELWAGFEYHEFSFV